MKLEKFVFIPNFIHGCGYFGNENLVKVYLIKIVSSTSYSKKKKPKPKYGKKENRAIKFDTVKFVVGVNDCDDGYLTKEFDDFESALQLFDRIVDGLNKDDLLKMGLSG